MSPRYDNADNDCLVLCKQYWQPIKPLIVHTVNTQMCNLRCATGETTTLAEIYKASKEVSHWKAHELLKTLKSVYWVRAQEQRLHDALQELATAPIPFSFLNFCRTEGSGSQLFILPLLARRSYPTTGNNSQRLLNKSLQLTAWTV